MDLGTVRSNLLKNKYESTEEFLNDIQLIWDNCKKYNQEGSGIFNIALKVEKHTEKAIYNA